MFPFSQSTRVATQTLIVVKRILISTVCLWFLILCIGLAVLSGTGKLDGHWSMTSHVHSVMPAAQHLRTAGTGPFPPDVPTKVAGTGPFPPDVPTKVASTGPFPPDVPTGVVDTGTFPPDVPTGH